MKRPGSRRRWLPIALGAFAAALVAGYLIVPEILVWSATLLIAEVAPFPSDAIVVLAGGEPARVREATDLYRAGIAPRVLITMQEPPDGYREMARLGVDLVLAHENYLRVLRGFGVPEERIVRIETPATETMDELRRIRRFAEQQGWRRLVIVTSNYHTRRALLISRYVFGDGWDIAVVASRYSEFRPDGWWREVRHARTFFIEFQKLLVYELYLQPRLWF